MDQVAKRAWNNEDAVKLCDGVLDLKDRWNLLNPSSLQQ